MHDRVINLTGKFLRITCRDIPWLIVHQPLGRCVKLLFRNIRSVKPMIQNASARIRLSAAQKCIQLPRFGGGLPRGGTSRNLGECFKASNKQYTQLRLINTQALHPLAFHETIYALSTAPGRAAIAIVRVSGPHCLEIYRSLCPSKSPPKPQQATVRTLHDPSQPLSIIDSAALILYFPSPRTVTGEDVLELHIHGGSATQTAVLAAISNVANTRRLPIRYAEPGEFTRRAFQNDKLDLAQVEALSDALSAETEQQRRAAVRGHSGKLGKIYEGWRGHLLYARGELEALIDFSEDQHFDESPTELLQNVTRQVNVMLQDIERHELASRSGELLKKGIRISLLGPPNAGKSSLLNLIVGREASIVSQEAGTTRDIVEVNLDIQGYLCTIADTAGLRESSQGAIELEGIKRAKAKASSSDVVIAMASLECDLSGEWSLNYDQETLEIAAKAPAPIFVLNKVDQAHKTPTTQSFQEECIQQFTNLITSLPHQSALPTQSPPICTISCLEAQTLSPSSTPSQHRTLDAGRIGAFTSHLVGTFKTLTDLPPDMADLIGVTSRQSQLLTSCAGHLVQFKTEAESEEADIVLAAEHLRAAGTCLARITGRGDAGDVEEVLGVVFEKYIDSPFIV